MTEIDTSTLVSDNQEETKEIKSHKHNKLWEFLIVALLVIATIIGVAYFEICKAPYYGAYNFGDTKVTVNANYNSKYNVIKIDFVANEIIEDWQVRASNGKVLGIKLICETSDKSIKKEFQFDDISLQAGEKIETSLSIENAKLKDFLLVKDLLDGSVSIQYPQIINFDSAEREEIKQYYTSGAAVLGDLFLYYMMGGL